MENKKTHWRNLTNEKYLGHWDLEINGEYLPMNVTVEKIYKGDFVGEMGKEQKVFAKFKEFAKSMLLNKTNLKALELATKTFDPDKFVGFVVTLKVEKAKIKGATVDALRISPNLPVLSKPVLNPDHEKWEQAKKAIQNGQTTIDKVMQSYVITDEHKAFLTAKTEENDSE